MKCLLIVLGLISFSLQALHWDGKWTESTAAIRLREEWLAVAEQRRECDVLNIALFVKIKSKEGGLRKSYVHQLQLDKKDAEIDWYKRQAIRLNQNLVALNVGIVDVTRWDGVIKDTLQEQSDESHKNPDILSLKITQEH